MWYISGAGDMREELPPNEDVIFTHQNQKVLMSRGFIENKSRQVVSTSSVIIWHLLALVSLNLWLLRLLGYIPSPW